ncbi:hypothetical protein [Streptomyces sp. ISL-94]|uniref:hypothetical protein n=1 Tax=Streptomyces sp. ISL-94 TaxID=2819190 RepID=UPI002035D5FD|nr:hypothetical protein [Streptomyces sp. ISL-94]
MPIRPLPYRKPTRGRDYWVLDDVLPDADSVRARCLAKDDWVQGAPHKPEPWPGLRAMPALEPPELARVERLVRQATGAPRIWADNPAGAGTFNHNCVQVVGKDECEPRPHTDSRTVCRYAAVLYLSPDTPEDCGTRTVSTVTRTGSKPASRNAGTRASWPVRSRRVSIGWDTIRPRSSMRCVTFNSRAPAQASRRPSASASPHRTAP